MPSLHKFDLESRTTECIEDARESMDGSLGEGRIIDTGDLGRVVIFANSSLPVALKIPRYSKEHVRRYGDTWYTEVEETVLPYLEEKAAYQKPPLQVPALYWASHHPRYLALSYLPGNPLSRQELRQLGPDEQRDYGTRIAEQVYWLAGAMDPKTYKMYFPFDRTLNRLHMFDLYNNRVWHNDIEAKKALTLVDAVYELDDHYRRLRRAKLIEPTIVGHDDLNPGNLLFEGEAPNRRVTGVIDFGLTKLSTPERELRFLPFVGEIAVKAALKHYEEISGTPLSEDALRFWARIQATTTAVLRVIGYGKAPTDMIIERMEQAWQGEQGFDDWSELARIPDPGHSELQQVS